MIKVFLVDDHDLMREGIRALLEQDPQISVVGEAGDGGEAVRAIRGAKPDVVLMDISLPGGIGGFEATEAILGDDPNVKVIILTQYENREYIKRAIRIGAHGYLLKRSSRRRSGRCTAASAISIPRRRASWPTWWLRGRPSTRTSTRL